MARGAWMGLLLAMWAGCSQSPTGARNPAPTAPPEEPISKAPADCSPATCATLGQTCGPAYDGCGGTLDCGRCPAPDTCEPVTCSSYGRTVCGVLSDGCGNALDCGGCTGDAVCGGGSRPNECATPPQRASCTQLRGKEALEPVSGGIQGLRQCNADGWCTSNGYMGLWAEDLWGFSDSDVWAVGGWGRGVALHWNGSGWSQVELPSPEPLRGIWGASPDDVWAVGEHGAVLRWNGTAWRRVPAPTAELLTGVSGTSADDVWLVGPTVALHWDGKGLSVTTGWTPYQKPPEDDNALGRTSVWAISANDVVAAGGSLCQRWDGKSWSKMGCGVRRATDVWASGPNDIWVVGEYYSGYTSFSQRAHWDGQTWKTESFSDQYNNDFESFRALWGFASNDVWLNGSWHFDGKKWNRICRDTPQLALWGSPSGRLFGSSMEQGLARLEEPGWTLQSRTLFRYPSLGRTPTGSTWGIGSKGALIQFDGQRWSRHSAPAGQVDDSLYTPFGTSPEDAWAISYGRGLYRWDGQQWAHSGPPNLLVSASWAVSPTEAFVVGYDYSEPRRRLWRWDGQQWSPLDVDLGRDDLTAMWGSGPDDVWAVGSRPPLENTNCPSCGNSTGVAWHWNGQQWRRVYEAPGQFLTSVFGTSRSNVWALDFLNGGPTRATALRWNGSTFESTGQFHDTQYLEHLAGTGPEDMWVAAGLTQRGTHTRLYHFDGRRWTEQAPLPGRIHDMGAIPGQYTFATTEDGTFYERRAAPQSRR